MVDVTELKTTPLDAFHREHGGKMVPFAGYSMPVQYALGVMKEHLHTRSAAGLFDVSHMGQIEIRSRSGSTGDAALALERLIPADYAGLAEGRQRYGFFTNAKGGIEDDLMVANMGDQLFVVVNAACKHDDFAYLRSELSTDCDVVLREDRALLALQGPLAGEVLAGLAPETASMRFMDVRAASLAGADCIVSRSGYTGEDGFEISVPGEQAEALAATLSEHDAVELIGLGARDSLRLEAGLCLYGSDIDQQTTPVEAQLVWAMQKARRRGGAREGGFPGADIILEQIDSGVSRRRVGLVGEGRTPIRADTQLFASEEAEEPIGRVTSGGFGPSVGQPVAMGYVETGHSDTGTTVFAEVRGKRIPARVSAMPFITPTYKR